jgi:hypothetical protein
MCTVRGRNAAIRKLAIPLDSPTGVALRETM